MVAFYLDENIALAVETELRSRGHVVTSTYAEGRSAAPDPLLLLEAAERNWTFVTHNRKDYRLLHDAWLRWEHAWGVRQPHAGILVLDRVQGQSGFETARLIDAVTRDPTTNLIRALYDWSVRSGWVRFPA
jgi:Domain of unknown function (DUF5615)